MLYRHVSAYRPGASLRVWRDFFPNAVIYGWDIDPSAMVYDEERIKYGMMMILSMLRAHLGLGFDYRISSQCPIQWMHTSEIR